MLNDCNFYHLVLPNYKLNSVFSNSNPNPRTNITRNLRSNPSITNTCLLRTVTMTPKHNNNSHQRQLIAEPPRARGGAPIAIENGNLSMHANFWLWRQRTSVRPNVLTDLAGIFRINSLWLSCRSERGSKEEYAWYFQLPAMELQALKDTLTSMAAAAESFPCEKLKLCP